MSRLRRVLCLALRADFNAISHPKVYGQIAIIPACLILSSGALSYPTLCDVPTLTPDLLSQSSAWSSLPAPVRFLYGIFGSSILAERLGSGLSFAAGIYPYQEHGLLWRCVSFLVISSLCH